MIKWDLSCHFICLGCRLDLCAGITVAIISVLLGPLPPNIHAGPHQHTDNGWDRNTGDTGQLWQHMGQQGPDNWLWLVPSTHTSKSMTAPNNKTQRDANGLQTCEFSRGLLLSWSWEQASKCAEKRHSDERKFQGTWLEMEEARSLGLVAMVTSVTPRQRCCTTVVSPCCACFYLLLPKRLPHWMKYDHLCCGHNLSF